MSMMFARLIRDLSRSRKRTQFWKYEETREMSQRLTARHPTLKVYLVYKDVRVKLREDKKLHTELLKVTIFKFINIYS